MNEIITKLNEIEEKAEAIISDANARKEQMQLKLEAEKKRLDEKYRLKEQETERRIREQKMGEAEVKMQALREKTRHSVEEMEQRFAEEKERLAEEIFACIIE